MNKNKTTVTEIRNPKLVFDSALFWDAEEIDLQKHSAYVIARVLDYGDWKDVKILRTIYSDAEIIDVIKKRRGLMRQTGKYWAVIFNLPLEEIACLKRYYPGKH